MEKKSEFGDDVCGYYDKNQNYYYVKPCDSGKYCVNPDVGENYLSICQDVPKVEKGLSTLGEDCNSDFDCEVNLKCNGKKCTFDCTNANEYPYRQNPLSGFYCAEKAPEGYCEYKEYKSDGTIKIYHSMPPNKLQKCGVITFHPEGNNYYTLKDTKYAYIGSVESGEYVNDKSLCKSGFTLYYYPEGYLDDPSTGSPNQRRQRCVTPIDIDFNDKLAQSCVIYYKEKDGDTEIKKYNVDQYNPGNLCTNFNYVKIRMEKFKEFNDKLTDDEREKCGDLSIDSNYRYTCDNKDLIKSWYFYEHPEHYIVYNEREKLQVVLNHLIQKEFPLYQFSKILNIKNIITLIFLLYF